MPVSYNQVKLPRWAWIGLALIPLAAAAASVIHGAKVAADATYVRRDSFAVYRAGQSWKDTALAQLWRACIHEGRCS